MIRYCIKCLKKIDAHTEYRSYSDYRPAGTIRYCGNPECERYGLVAVIFKKVEEDDPRKEKHLPVLKDAKGE